ncbi:Hypothetical predicted protein [Octopus vulgaris]|uniref:Uncharacterized protein n=1 Tax=Octopus vulgaris TaxID=6645 RepID=A0AA36AWZ5_OCTVU|nr:Hypothetical predicted protein [Octopus vulgaris]
MKRWEDKRVRFEYGSEDDTRPLNTEMGSLIWPSVLSKQRSGYGEQYIVYLGHLHNFHCCSKEPTSDLMTKRRKYDKRCCSFNKGKNTSKSMNLI